MCTTLIIWSDARALWVTNFQKKLPPTPTHIKMESSPKYNTANPSVKRILREMKEMEQEPNPQYTAVALEVIKIVILHCTLCPPPPSFLAPIHSPTGHILSGHWVFTFFPLSMDQCLLLAFWSCVLFFSCAHKDNIFEWHFTVRGPPDTPFEGGIYHGRILLPPEYPFKPPNFVFMTVSSFTSTPCSSQRAQLVYACMHYQENGRFEVGTKICLSISAHHPEHWQPSWSSILILSLF